MLDALPDESLEDVLCCYRDLQDGKSRISRLGDINQFPSLMAQGSLGELVTQQILDRFLKDSSTVEQYQQRSFEWLEALENEVNP